MAGLDSDGRLAADFGALFALGSLAAIAGLLLNAVRPEALPWRYVSPQQRMQEMVARLTRDPAPTGLSVAQIGLEEIRRMTLDRSGLILDARPDVFYREGHIPGALNLARATFATDYQRLRPRLEAGKDRITAVYCSDADCPDGGIVASALRQLGYRQVVEFEPGWEAWTAAGLAEEKLATP